MRSAFTCLILPRTRKRSCLKERPLYARVAKDNVASIRVLERCGFEVCGEDRGFSNARSEEVEEYILKLEA
jgi:RimJ/RimL family protein N-acetyltransferase